MDKHQATIAEQATEIERLHRCCEDALTLNAPDYKEMREKIAEQAMQLEEMAEAIRVKDALLSNIAKQTPEKPDYWSSCSQCERNSAEAEDALTAPPSPEILAARDHRVAEAISKLCDRMQDARNENGYGCAAAIRAVKTQTATNCDKEKAANPFRMRLLLFLATI